MFYLIKTINPDESIYKEIKFILLYLLYLRDSMTIENINKNDKQIETFSGVKTGVVTRVLVTTQRINKATDETQILKKQIDVIFDYPVLYLWFKDLVNYEKKEFFKHLNEIPYREYIIEMQNSKYFEKFFSQYALLFIEPSVRLSQSSDEKHSTDISYEWKLIPI